ncbi:DUF2141 domain-containing protein [Flavobacterium sp. ZT3R18]|uniref:DUF2141 domain-containing protein n=1 Tax=Flavobacterium sp. ZT3R18 TaxID=2594429 RepID=UPI00117AAA55|nr:DUF2141 domain-containing protein [Flavobacterium sp. ZT3R18]TRX36868.1 DUF2141 domain-containing protein [Flavobacterium sp. ZT3R18]
MLKIITTIAFFVCSLMSAQNVNLTVSVSGLKNNTGVLKVGLYNSEGTFLKSIYKSIRSEIKENGAKVTFEGIPKGEYAISVYQDENNNGKLDKNVMGIPSEDVACSNNAKGFMGPPKYKDAKFDIEKNQIIEIKF